MGCNYYLYKKNADKWVLPLSRLGSLFEQCVYDEIQKGNTQQLTLNMGNCTTQEDGLHIGKSSFGWHFNLCIYPCMGIYNLEDWERLFDDEDYYIMSEENKELTGDEMLDVITNRKGSSQLTDEELKENHAERGLNNLLAHSSSIWDERDKEEWKQFMPMLTSHYRTDGTYDLTPDWDFS